MHSKRFAAIAIALACSVVLSCAGTKAPDMGSSLWGSMGGVSAVSGLTQSFGKELAGNASLSRQLGAQGVQQVERGLYNSLGQAAGYKIDKGTDLLSVLKKKNLDEDSVEEVGMSLEAAAKKEGLRSDQRTMLKGLWEPIEKQLD